MTFIVISPRCFDRNRLDTGAPKSTSSNEQQLSLDLQMNEHEGAIETHHWQNVADLDREAEEARFDWLELRHTPYAPVLWRTFVHKSELLQRALARKP